MSESEFEPYTEEELATAKRISDSAHVVEWVAKVRRHEQRLMKEVEALKELVRELVKFTGHDKACAELLTGAACTCGIRRLYDKVDRFVD